MEQADDEFIPKQHLSFRVDSLQDVIETLTRLGEHDYKTGEVNLFKHQNYKWCEWLDPSGIRLECVETL